MGSAISECAVVLRRCRGWLPLQTKRSAGNIALYMAVILTSLMGLAGAGVDYGLIVIETARLQNALDAAALAGARALVVSTATGQSDRDTAGEAAAAAFLHLHGYDTGVNGLTIAYVESSSDTTTGASHDTMQVTGTLIKPTSFWKVIGINSTTLTRTSTAVASGGMVDVMLSLDLTKSMEMSGYDDIGNLQDAVVAFINQMQLSTTDPRGSQVGIARWAGTVCSWSKIGQPTPVPTPTRTPNPTWTPVPTPTGANWDTRIDWGASGPSSNTGEYTTPCYGDSTVLAWLSQDKATLTKIAANTGTGVCPTKPAAPSTPAPYSPGSMSQYACPLVSYTFPVNGIMWNYDNQTRATGMTGHSWSGVTGTNLANSIKIVNGNATGCYAWATSTTACPTNGRNDASTGLARKVLVIITDGFSQEPADDLPAAYPTYTSTAGGRYTAPSSWNAEVVDLANRLKRGPDNDINTLDDNVEIYVVGFFPVPYSSSTSFTNWARSKAAATGTVAAGTHPCPAATLPSGTSTFSYVASSVDPGVDELLNNVSSSKSGSCDHYFPIAKSEGGNLPQLFRVMAGSIARGRLQ